VAYLGANGSGKTTTVRVLTGLLTPGNGRVLVDGHSIEDDLVGYRRRVGYVPETADVYPFLSGREYLQLVGRLRSLRDEVLDERVVRRGARSWTARSPSNPPAPKRPAVRLGTGWPSEGWARSDRVRAS
jgi:ABC-type uncharacterized transport system ATPase subunit